MVEGRGKRKHPGESDHMARRGHKPKGRKPRGNPRKKTKGRKKKAVKRTVQKFKKANVTIIISQPKKKTKKKPDDSLF